MKPLHPAAALGNRRVVMLGGLLLLALLLYVNDSWWVNHAGIARPVRVDRREGVQQEEEDDEATPGEEEKSIVEIEEEQAAILREEMEGGGAGLRMREPPPVAKSTMGEAPSESELADDDENGFPLPKKRNKGNTKGGNNNKKNANAREKEGDSDDDASARRKRNKGAVAEEEEEQTVTEETETEEEEDAGDRNSEIEDGDDAESNDDDPGARRGKKKSSEGENDSSSTTSTTTTKKKKKNSRVPDEVPPLPTVDFDETNPTTREWRPNTGVHLITTFFKGTYHKKRVAEIIETLRRNVENPYFETVHILWEDANPRLDLLELGLSKKILDRKLVTSKVKNQPTYFRMFAYSNTILERGAIAVISNADIYFDKSIGSLKFGTPAGKPEYRSAMALSRRHSPDCGAKRDWLSTYDLCDHYIGSHDSFVFAPPVPNFILKNTIHTQNHFGAENIVVWAFLWAKGYNHHVTNPCSRIRGFHLHCSVERHYVIGSFISAGRHGRVRPGIEPGMEKEWFYIH